MCIRDRPSIMPNFIEIGRTSLEKSITEFGPRTHKKFILSRTETWLLKSRLAVCNWKLRWNWTSAWRNSYLNKILLCVIWQARRRCPWHWWHCPAITSLSRWCHTHVGRCWLRRYHIYGVPSRDFTYRRGRCQNVAEWCTVLLLCQRPSRLLL